MPACSCTSSSPPCGFEPTALARRRPLRAPRRQGDNRNRLLRSQRHPGHADRHGAVATAERLGIYSRQLLTFGHDATVPFSIDRIVADAAQAADDGLHSYWLPQQFEVDSFVLVASIATAAPSLELGVAVAPIWLRSPIQMAQSAATAGLLSGGRFTLGLGVEHRPIVETLWHQRFDHPVDRLREYVVIVDQLINQGHARLDGTHYGADMPWPRHGDLRPPRVPILLGALGPRMLHLAATHSTGTVTWLAGRQTLRHHVVPAVTTAAAESGRAPPRIVAILPVVATADTEAARQRIGRSLAAYADMPSYRAVLQREQVAGAADIALIGGHHQILDAIHDLADAGITDLAALTFAANPTEHELTRAALRAATATIGHSGRAATPSPTAGLPAAVAAAVATARRDSATGHIPSAQRGRRSR